LIRHSLKYVPRRRYDAVVKDLKPIYTAIDADQALVALETFEEKWDANCPAGLAHAVLPDRDLRELAMHVQSDTLPRHLLTSNQQM
jgi:transposase-like protein